MATPTASFPIGSPGVKWGEDEKARWLAMQSIKRSYENEVLVKLEPLKELFDVEKYGVLLYESGEYPLFAFRTRGWESSKKTVLVTGGVHGYETSGVQGAIRFLQTRALSYAPEFNVVVVPCVSPWGYETINRWNPYAIDPNRSFVGTGHSGESAMLMEYISSLKQRLLAGNGVTVDFIAHIDLHETTDTDNTTFRPARAARDGEINKNWNIPDGFYAVGDTEKRNPAFQKAIIDGVSAVTHIAPADDDGCIIGEKMDQPGVIHYAARELGLCMSLTEAPFVTTTEVYPDSPKVDDNNCTDAQVAAVTSALNFVRNYLLETLVSEA